MWKRGIWCFNCQILIFCNYVIYVLLFFLLFNCSKYHNWHIILHFCSWSVRAWEPFLANSFLLLLEYFLLLHFTATQLKVCCSTIFVYPSLNSIKSHAHFSMVWSPAKNSFSFRNKHLNQLKYLFVYVWFWFLKEVVTVFCNFMLVLKVVSNPWKEFHRHHCFTALSDADVDRCGMADLLWESTLECHPTAPSQRFCSSRACPSQTETAGNLGERKRRRL